VPANVFHITRRQFPLCNFNVNVSGPGPNSHQKTNISVKFDEKGGSESYKNRDNLAGVCHLNLIFLNSLIATVLIIIKANYIITEMR